MKTNFLLSKNWIRTFYIVGILLFVAEIMWLGASIYHTLNTPSLQTQAVTRLLQYQLIDQSEKESFFDETEKRGILIWPITGISYDQKRNQIAYQVQQILQKNYAKDFASLPIIEKRFLSEKALPSLEKKIKISSYVRSHDF